MIVRLGLVANSSSTCFMIDQDIPGALAIMYEAMQLPKMTGRLTRASGWVAGDDLRAFVDNYEDEIQSLYGEDQSDPFIEWVRGFVDAYGYQRLFLVRVSDEGMGGYIDIPYTARCIIGERDYH